MLTRRTVVTFEKLERCFYHFPQAEEPLRARCAECSEEVNWLTPNQAVLLTGLALREVFRRIEANTLHFSETAPGLIHICSNSLAQDGDLMIPGDSLARR